MSYRGIDIRQAGDRIIFREGLLDSNGNPVSSGAATLMLTRWTSTGDVETFDFSTFTWKTTTCTTPTVNMTHRPANGGAIATGLWSYALTSLGAFSRGDVVTQHVYHASASPPYVKRDIQYGEGEGDLTVSSAGAVTATGVSALQTEVAKIPRQGETYRHRNVDTDATADVTIEAAS